MSGVLPIHQDDTDNGRRHIHGPDDHCIQQSSICIAQRLKHLRGVENDGINAGELLECWHEDGDDQLWPVAAPEYDQVGVLDATCVVHSFNNIL